MKLRTLFKIFAFVFCFLFFAAHVFAGRSYDAFTVKVTGKGQPMIFIPGATCSGDEWNETVTRYSGKYECHVLTLAGYAGTQPLKNGPYLSTIKSQIEDYIITKKLDNVIIVGHSIGGVMAMWIGSEMHDHLQKIVIVDAMPFFAGANNPAAADTFNEAQAQGMLARYNQMNDSTMKASQSGITKFMCADSTRWNMIVGWGLKSDKKTMAYTMSEMLGKDLRKTIATIKVPTLILAAYATMPEYPQYTRELVGNLYGEQYKACTACAVHVSEENSRHFIMYDAPKWYFKELDNFFGK